MRNANAAPRGTHPGTVVRILLREARRPAGFILALVVGGILTFTRRFESVATVLPFVVPYLVTLLTRTTTRVASRRRDLLVDLPAYRRSPAFIMDCQGHIVAAVGETEALFTQHRITHLDQLLNGHNGRSAGEILLGSPDGTPGEFRAPSFFSDITNRWYRVQLRGDHRASDWLVWLDDITEQVRLEERRNSLREFTRTLQQELLENESVHDDDTRLAQLLLDEGYEAVMLARLLPGGAGAADDAGAPTNAGAAEGFVYTAHHRHGPITIPAGVDAPIMRSRREGRAIRDDVREWASRQEFERTYSVLPEVAAVIRSDIRNFANYHSGDVSIIAFNRAGHLTDSDIAVLESTADTAVTAFSLVDLARRADRRFIQSIHGVCAAAEYSDELTGGHIWRVNDYSRHIAAVMGLDQRTTGELGLVAALHDIGKVAIPHIIKLARPLDHRERAEMQMHTIYGTQIIDRMRRASGESDRRLEMAGRIALHHHQHWNGTGYPALMEDNGSMIVPESRDPGAYAGLRPPRGEEIPREALIVSLADKYDALRSCRQYKPAFPHHRVVELLSRDDRSGLTGEEVFGREVFQAFSDTHQEFARIYEAGEIDVSCEA